ncbi:hypothetical protein [Chitinophaga flava]|uniref:Uncharacterized protein n=1 Tax=Chitinophaga flava TaxID=2259036 RepID=A0A365Y2F2_9BACT|nr:hypothetical protein [Chitinophaga flava]RBL92777.1 hypothetical protein DF182_09420 [Chitinophaga flava]
MKQVLTLLSLCLLFWCGCKKVDDHAAQVADQPWFSEQYTQFTGSRLAPINWTYPSSLIVGDTATLVGKLFPTRTGTVISVGNVPIKIIDTAQLTPRYTTYSEQGQIDAVRFVVTREMGAGDNRPVTVTANGVTVYGPSVSIKLIGGSSLRTDTTLWVDQLAQWTPDNLSDYQKKNYNLIRSVHTDMFGNIYFDNQLSIQSFRNGNFTTILKAGDALKDSKNSSFSIKYILGSTITFTGDVLYFTTETTEDVPEAAQNYIFRLCKMDLASKTITTINRTLVTQNATTAETNTILQGEISQLKIVAMRLNTDVNNNLYYTNYYAPEVASGNHARWYNYVGGNFSGQVGQEPINGIIMVSKMDPAGQVRGIMSWKQWFPSIGIPVSTGYYSLDPSGKFLYGYYSSNWISYNGIQYNIPEDDQGVTLKSNQTQFAYHSYETNPEYKMTGTFAAFGVSPASTVLNNNIQLANGTTLIRQSHILECYDIPSQSTYTYAGVEAGINQTISEQNQTTGLAKWVDFSGVSLIGQDKSGALYFFRGNKADNPPIFYKLYPKKQ